MCVKKHPWDPRITAIVDRRWLIKDPVWFKSSNIDFKIVAVVNLQVITIRRWFLAKV